MSNPSPRQQELDRLRLVLLTFAEFYRSTIPGPLVDTMIEGIEQGYRAGAVGGMREALADELEALQDATGGQLRALDAMLQERAGVRLNDLQQRRLARLTAVRERGRITTEAQFRLVLARVDEVYADPTRAEEVAELNRLLADYETRPRRARRGG
jgi:hypothetical protein